MVPKDASAYEDGTPPGTRPNRDDPEGCIICTISRHYTTMYDGVGPRRGRLAVGATRGVAEISLKRVEVRRERAAGLRAQSRIDGAFEVPS